ncbi:MAG TPA: hypothetical protein VEA61_08530 [Allosphingosinicella sp.]|nr:hypothetical protein [Allosphingosinicella sp.]
MARHVLLPAAALIAGLALPPPAASAQPPAAPASLEARLRALEARVAALEGRSAAPAATPAAPAATGPACRRLNVNASRIPAGAPLTVTVNGTLVATYDENAYGDLEPFMRKGPNTIALIFAAAPAGHSAEAELRCLPPGVDSSRTTVLRLRPTPARLRAEAVVVLP